MKKPRSLLEEIAGLTDPTPRDFDPEDVSYDQREDADSGDDSDNRNKQATSHYEDVGESRLRKTEAATLGPQYVGAKVSRNVIDDEDEDDPFDRGFEDEEESSDDISDGLDDLVNGSDAEEEEDLGEGSDDEEESVDEESVVDGEEDGSDIPEEDEEMSDLSEDENLSTRPASKPKTTQSNGVDRLKLRKLMADDDKSVAQALNQSIKADAEKGIAVKQQRLNFDTLLNVRVKLQKALIATNSLSQLEPDVGTAEDGDQAMAAAEEAALKLWNNVSSLRSSLNAESTGQKRKFAQADEDTNLSILWSEIQRAESEAQPKRNMSLDFWSAKCRPAALTNPSRRLNAQTQQSLSSVLTGHMSDVSRLVAKTRVPRSCVSATVAQQLALKAGAQAGNVHEMKSNTSKLPIYDDADFYGVLLQQLISQRSDTSQGPAIASLGNLASEPWQAARATKTKRLDIDTKASKGRKLRYTVHEKLQNFMAPEDRTLWTNEQSDELFGNLFGMGIGLRETADANEGLEEEDVGAGIEGLRLFSGVPT